MSLPVATAMIRAVILLFIFFGATAHAEDPQAVALTKAERAELNLFRMAADPAYAKFAERSYEQVNESYELGLRALKWQLMASDVLMILVVFVTVSGVAMSAYQLWVSARLALNKTSDKREQEDVSAFATSTLQISPDKVSVQTALVGIMVLLISAALLLLFVREVYTIHPLNVPTIAGGPRL